MPKRKPPPVSLRLSSGRSLVPWYRLGLGIVALGLSGAILLRAVLERGSLPLVVAGLVLLAFGAWRLRAGWKLLKIRRVR